MRIEIDDQYARRVCIDSEDLEIIGVWFSEQVRRIATKDARQFGLARMTVYPTTQDEIGMFPIWQQPRNITRGEIERLAQHLTIIAKNFPKEVE